MSNVVSFSERVWKGDASAVADARYEWLSNPTIALIKYAMTLYSFRAERKYAADLLGLRWELMERAKEEIFRDFGGGTAHERANLADVLSTYLEWMSRQESLSVNERRKLRLIAAQVCEKSVAATDEIELEHHSWSLIKLTAARIALGEGDRSHATHYLNRVAKRAPDITDMNQRVRVYAKLGFLLRETGWHIRGFFWGVRACCVGGVPWNVRKKAFASLLGIER